MPNIEIPMPNLTVVSSLGVDYYFSYKTCVACRIKGKLIVMKNEWSTTTGKHLNHIDGGTPEAKKRRVDRKTFEAKLSEVGL